MPVNRLRRLAPVIIIGGLGLILLIFAGWMVVTQTQGTIGQCQTQLTRPSRNGMRFVEQVCDVTWEAGGTTHRAAVRMGRTGYTPGETVELRVSGEHARPAISVWASVGTAGQGTVLLLAALVVYRRTSK